MCSCTQLVAAKKPLHEGLDSMAGAAMGDIVTIDLDLRPENGFVPEPLFDTTGRMSFILGWGNYLPGLHELLCGMSPGEERKGVSIDAGWGERSASLIFEVPKSNFKSLSFSSEDIQPGTTLNLQGGIQVSVVRVTDDVIVVDGNHPLAGASYACSVTLVSVDQVNPQRSGYQEEDSHESPFHVATFALGCFWGGELAYSRAKGVVGTKVGYSQGVTINPTYEEVCQGTTKHREAIMVVFDSREVTYSELLDVFLERLRQTAKQQYTDLSSLFQEDGDEASGTAASDDQYNHGIYFHSPEQRRQVEKVMNSMQRKHTIELRRVAVFYDAEEYHQQYLLKGGQSAKKGAKETIRCFG